MTPKEKAEELVKKYSCYFHGIDENLFEEVVIHDDSKGCAIVAVDEILKTFDITTPSQIEYWQQVKHEIEQL
jgi:L-rhamnose mutarotase